MPMAAAIFGGSVLGLFGAKKSADASKSAAQTQVAAGDRAAQLQFDLGNRALNVQQQQYGQAQENMRPFLGYGRGAANMLGTLMGVQPDYPRQIPMPTGSVSSTVGGMYGQGVAVPRQGTSGDTGNIPERKPHGMATGRMPANRAPWREQQRDMMADTAEQVQAAGGQNTRSSYGAQGTVHIRWPSGQEQDVPAYQADQYKALGAQEVTG